MPYWGEKYKNKFTLVQGWGDGRSRVFLTPCESEPFEKKTVAGAAWKKKSEAVSAKNLAGSSAVREDKKHKEIVLKFLFLGKIKVFMIKKNNYFTWFIFFAVLPY